MTYLIDTHLVVSYLNGRVDAIEVFRSLTLEGIQISAVTSGEVLEGLQQSSSRAIHQRHEFVNFASEFGVLSVTHSVAQIYARERAHLRTRGMLIPDNDIWIAATALSHDLQLVSGDQHFQRVQGLRVYSP